MIVNIAAYKFVTLDDLESLRQFWLRRTRQLALKGTILLSGEGINMFVAGPRSPIELFLDEVRADERFVGLNVKESLSETIPFNRMLVKIKKEIIAFGIDGIAPEKSTVPKLAADELKKWLDEDRDLMLFDVRNDFEVEVGTFENAVPAGIGHFRDFERSLDAIPQSQKHKPIVMFCTGGIRCEKAGPLMRDKGFTEVYQLDGGILKYFETCGEAHYRGDCFVFDGRVALDPNLQVTGLAQCFQCQAIVSIEDQMSPMYVVGESCPRCFRTAEQQMRERIASRQVRIAELASELPGSRPHQQRRPIRIPARMDGWELIGCFSTLLPQIPNADWELAFAEHRILDGTVPARAARIVRGGEQFQHVVESFIEPDVNGAITILYEDRSIVVVDKPAPLPVHPSGRFFHNTLTRFLDDVYRPEIMRAVHRLDANTTGVLVLARCRATARVLQRQFERQQTEKVYLARCHGLPPDDAFRCELPIGEQQGPGRIRIGDSDGGEALTKFRVLRRFGDHTSLLEVQPVTGRTNQIRVHLWELGFPILGDPLYLRDRKLGQNEVLGIAAPPMCLHADRITFCHPETGERVTHAVVPPRWCEESLPEAISR